jgi:hypothetical protein
MRKPPTLRPDSTPTEGVRILQDDEALLRIQCGLKETAFDRKASSVSQNGRMFCCFSDIRHVVIKHDEQVGEEAFPPRLVVSLELSKWRRLRIAFTLADSEALSLARQVAAVVGAAVVPSSKATPCAA